MMRTLLVLFSAILIGVIDGCSDMGSNPPKAPHITSIQPDSAFAGDTLKIVGTDFGASKGSSTVSVGVANADTIYLWSSTEIRLKIPASAVTGNLTVTVGGTASNAVTFKVRGTIAPDVPFITSIQPDSAFAGDTLKIVGSSFGASKGSSTVAVGGANADTIYLWSATEIRLKIPASAVTGKVIVTVSGTASNAVTFKVRGTVAPNVPFITSIKPDSAFAGDTLKILGTDFGASKGSSTVAVGGKNADTIYLWSATEIRLKIPAAAVTGNVTVTVGGTASNAVTFKVRGTVVTGVSFANDVFPVFMSAGCTGCHGGTNNLRVDTHAQLMLGTSANGPVVIAGNGEGSVIIKKLRGTASFGDRMPQGGPFLSNSVIDKISLWITQGAKNN